MITPVTILRHQSSVADVCFYDDACILSGTTDGEVTLWDKEIMRPKVELAKADPVLSVQVRQEHAGEIFVQRKGGIVERCNIEVNGANVSSTATGSTSFARMCQVTPSTFLIPLRECCHLGLFEMDNASPKLVLQMESDSYGSIMDVRQYQSHIAVAYERCVALWDLAQPASPIETWQVPAAPDAALTCITSVGKQLWVASHHGDMWALKTNPLKTKKLPVVPGGIGNMLARDDNRLVVVAGWDKKAHLRAANGSVLGVLEGHEGAINAVAFRGSRFATAAADAQVFLWDVYAG